MSLPTLSEKSLVLLSVLVANGDVRTYDAEDYTELERHGFASVRTVSSHLARVFITEKGGNAWERYP